MYDEKEIFADFYFEYTSFYWPVFSNLGIVMNW